MSGTIIARYDGYCAGCDDTIEAGDAIGYFDSEVMHETCAETATQREAEAIFGDDLDVPERAPRPVPTCDTCWTPVPCFCEDGQ